MYFIINLSGSQQFSGSSIQNQVELSEWATGRFMHCTIVVDLFHLENACFDFNPQLLHEVVGVNSCQWELHDWNDPIIGS